MKLRYGTEVATRDGRIVEIRDRAGHAHATLAWDGDRLRELVVDGARVCGDVIDDPLLGAAHAIVPTGTALSALDWARPREIPTVADPARLPPGAGGAILNALAHLAHRADAGPLRYAGPYNTPALYRALARSFHTAATEAEFCADVYARAGRLARDPLPFELAPDPCERVRIPGGWVELRRGLERVVHDGVTFEGAAGIARLVPDDDAWAAEVWFGDQRYARIGLFRADGTPLDGPRPIPACTSSVIGRGFPPPLRAALAELVAELVPAPLADRAREIVGERPLAWADLGGRAARACSHATPGAGGFEIHAAIWERVAPAGMARVALAIAEALAPVVTTTIVRELVVHFAP